MLDQATDATLANAISGGGNLTKAGSGNLTLSGTNSYTGGTTLSAGTLTGSASSFGSGAILNNAALVLDQNTDATLANAVSGSGSLTKTGSGKLIVSNTNSYTGATTVNGGSLIVGGSAGSTASLTSSVNVSNGALLGGHGRISGNVDMASGATLAPGNSIGTLTVDGDVTFTPGSTLEIEADADGRHDRLIATGTVNLGGASLNVLAGAGTWPPSTGTSILQAANLTGTFGNVSSNFAFLTPNLTYSATGLTLTLERNDISFVSVAHSDNQRSLARALESANGGQLYSTLAGLSAEQARSAFDHLSGEIHASLLSSLLDDSRHVREAVNGRLRASQSDLDAGNVLHSDADAGLTFWLKGYGNWSQKDGNHNIAERTRDTRGTLFGIDVALNDTWRLGVAASYGTSDLEVGQRDSSADINSTSMAAYLAGHQDALSLRLGVAHSWNQVDSTRDVQIGALHETLKADYNADVTQVFGELGYAVQFSGLTIEPFIGLAHVSVGHDAVREQGGAAALRGESQNDSVNYASFGLHVAAPLDAIADRPLSLQASLVAQHAFDGAEVERELNLSGYDSFTVNGMRVARDSGLAQLSLHLLLASGASLELGYSGQFGDGNSDQGLHLGLSKAF